MITPNVIGIFDGSSSTSVSHLSSSFVWWAAPVPADMCPIVAPIQAATNFRTVDQFIRAVSRASAHPGGCLPFQGFLRVGSRSAVGRRTRSLPLGDVRPPRTGSGFSLSDWSIGTQAPLAPRLRPFPRGGRSARYPHAFRWTALITFCSQSRRPHVSCRSRFKAPRTGRGRSPDSRRNCTPRGSRARGSRRASRRRSNARDRGSRMLAGTVR